MAEHNYNFNITMTCGGCSGAVERVLKKLDGSSFLPFSVVPLPCSTTPPAIFTRLTLRSGVKSYNVSLDSQTADVVAEDSLDYSTVLEKIKKTGKTVNSGRADGVEQTV